MKLEEFGKDHWSTFAYAETCCVDSKGRLDSSRLRINGNKHPLMGGNGTAWNPIYGTRAKDGKIPCPDHDDWDCLEELEREDLIEIVGTMINPVVKLTGKGIIVAGDLRRHKANGEQFATFESNI